MAEHCKVYRRRWIMLILFVLCSSSNSSHWIQYSIIANVCMYYYDVSAIFINWTAMIFMAMYILLVFPASWLLEKKGLRVALILGALFVSIGAWLKVLTANPDRFILTFLAQTITGAAQTFTFGVPARLAALWFPQKQVATACAIGAFGNLLGVAIGFLVPPAVVDDIKDKEVIGDQLQLLYIGMAVAPTTILVLILFFFEECPPHPPSMAQVVALRKERGEGSYLSSIRQLLANTDFSLLLISYGVIFGVFNTFSTMLNQELVNFPAGFENAGRVGLTLVMGGVIGSIVLGVVLDKTHKYKEVTLSVYIMTLLGMLGYTFGLHSQHLALVFTASAFIGFFVNGFMTVGYDFAAELTFPLSESTASGLLNAAGDVCGIVFIHGTSVVLKHFGAIFTNLLLMGVLVLGLVLSIPISKHRLQRMAANQLSTEDRTIQNMME